MCLGQLYILYVTEFHLLFNLFWFKDDLTTHLHNSWFQELFFQKKKSAKQKCPVDISHWTFIRLKCFISGVGHFSDIQHVSNFLDLNVRGIWLISLYLMNDETNMLSDGPTILGKSSFIYKSLTHLTHTQEDGDVQGDHQ